WIDPATNNHVFRFAQSGIDGAYSFIGISGGETTLTINAPSYAQRSFSIDGIAWQNIGQKGPLQQGLRALGIELGSGGQPISNATVYLQDKSAPRAVPVIATTAGDGKWDVRNILAGNYGVTVVAEGFAVYVDELTIASDGSSSDIKLKLGESTFSGVVTI